MKTPSYKYRVLSEPNPLELENLINTAVTKGWELVPAQSVSVTACPYYQDGEVRDTEWSYAVMMRMLA